MPCICLCQIATRKSARTRTRIAAVRDVGVAGSNPVTQTIDSKRYFLQTNRLGAGLSTTGGEPRGEIRLVPLQVELLLRQRLSVLRHACISGRRWRQGRQVYDLARLDRDVGRMPGGIPRPEFFVEIFLTSRAGTRRAQHDICEGRSSELENAWIKYIRSVVFSFITDRP